MKYLALFLIVHRNLQVLDRTEVLRRVDILTKLPYFYEIFAKTKQFLNPLN